VRHGVLLAVGVRPASDEAAELAAEAARAGHAALVVKCYGESAAGFAAIAAALGLAVLTADDDMAWHLLDALLSSALTAISRSPGRNAPPAVGDLFALANAIAAQTGGATAIEDPLRRILAYSTLPGQPIDEDRRQGILGLQVPDLPENDFQYRELARTEEVCRFTGGAGKMPRLAIAVRAGHDPLGTIWVVDENGSLDADADQALAEAARIAALHILAARTAADVARRQRGDLLHRLLSDPASADLAALQLGSAIDAPVAVAAFVIARHEPTDQSGEALAAHTATRFTDLISLHCEAHYGWSGCALIDGTVYALLPAHPAGRDHRRQVADIARRAQQALRVPVRAALGAQVAGLRAAITSRQDADLVLRVLAARALSSSGGPFSWGPGSSHQGSSEEPVVAAIDEVRASATLAELGQALAGLLRLREGTGQAIRAHDAAHGTAYADTLLAYLNADGDVAAAAQRLGVHPNTCRYRLTRAEQAVGFSLADPDQRLLLWLELRLVF
jgi:PucR C-terminal helix-turn-helix domain/GGDEF-like domain